MRRPGELDGRQLVNLAGAALIYLVVAAPWYVPNFSATLDYIRSTTGGPLSEGAGPTDPLTFHAITSFTTGVIDFNLSWVILLLGLIAVALNGAQAESPVQPAARGPSPCRSSHSCRPGR